MPLSTEAIRQRPLSGPELLEIVLRKAREYFSRDGMFQPHVGYGRVGFRFRLELEMDNLTYPKHASGTSSRRSQEEGEEALESFPLAEPGPEAVAADLALSQRIESPNASRIENDLPIRVQVFSQGKLEDKELFYEKEGLPSQPPVSLEDRSEEAFAALQARKPKSERA